MGLFGGGEDRARYGAIKDEYRKIKADIIRCTSDAWAEVDVVNSKVAPQFEYLTLENVEQDALNHHGLLGWELVNFSSYTVGFGVGGNSSMKVHLRYVFKRPMQPLSEQANVKFDQLKGLLSRKAELVAEITRRGDVAE